jgi:hypothetical protein
MTNASASLARSNQASYPQPQLAVDDRGRVGLSMLAYAGGAVEVLLFISEYRRMRFGHPLRVTIQGFDPTRGT